MIRIEHSSFNQTQSTYDSIDTSGIGECQGPVEYNMSNEYCTTTNSTCWVYRQRNHTLDADHSISCVPRCCNSQWFIEVGTTIFGKKRSVFVMILASCNISSLDGGQNFKQQSSQRRILFFTLTELQDSVIVVHLEKVILNISSLSFAIRLNLLHVFL